MPELPEVETTRRGILPHIKGQVIDKLEIHQPKLRWPIPVQALTMALPLSVIDVQRRAKYLLVNCKQGVIILHLGMSGRCHIIKDNTPAGKHDHIDFVFTNKTRLRFHDPRRFGCVLWTTEDPQQHPLLRHCGPEPLSNEFTGESLHQRALKRSKTVKEFIMDQRIVVGVGNIYAQEALFAAGIHPKRAAGRVSLQRYLLLVQHIKNILQSAIEQGGTTLRDFLGVDGQPGYFTQALAVYGREGKPCHTCGHKITSIRLGNRASCYCPQCQH